MTTEVQNEDQVSFAMKHGDNTSRVMEPDLLAAIATLLDGNEVQFHGKKCTLKVLAVSQRDDQWSCLFDVKNPDDTYDHVEFKIIKTGWGRAL